MLFNSWSFLLCFPIVVLGHWQLPAHARWAWLLAASCVFYAAFVPAYLLILFAVIGVGYPAGRLFARSEGLRTRDCDAIGLLRAPRRLAALQVLSVFRLVTFALIWFRAAPLADVAVILARLHMGWEPAAVESALNSIPRISRTDLPLDAAFVTALLAAEAWQRRGGVAALDRWPRGLRLAAYQAIALVLAVFGVYDSHAIICFQF